MKKHIYLDYAATTPVDSAVLEKMYPYFQTYFGNPSSMHWFGEQAAAILMQSRDTVAQLFGVSPEEVIFTGSGTESNNLAIRSTPFYRREKHGAATILTTPIEHPGVAKTIEQLVRINGLNVEYLPVDQYGMVDPEDVRHALSNKIAMVSVMHANNEIGTLNPVAEIGKYCREHGIPFHTDSVQAAAHLDFTLSGINADFVSVGAHKFYGPKGVGALIARKNIPIEASITGGSQEYGKRAGTQNIPLIIGFTEALKVLRVNLKQDVELDRKLQKLILEQVLGTIPDAKLTGHPTQRLSNHSSFVFKGIDGNQLLKTLDSYGYACSSGSACKSGIAKENSVLKALGFSNEWSTGSVRITTGRDTTTEDVNGFCELLAEVVRILR